MVTMYFSGAENTLHRLRQVHALGYSIRGLMLTFMKIKSNRNETERAKYIRKSLGTKIMIDSGAHSLLFAYGSEQRATTSWHKNNIEAQAMIDNNGYERYFDVYYRWLKFNRDAYDYAVELDIQSIVGHEKVIEWRKKLLEDNIPIIFVIHTDAGDNFDTLKEWKSMGCQYVGFGGFNDNNPLHIKLVEEAHKLGLKIHLFAYAKPDIYERFPYIESIDSTGYVMGSKFGEMHVFNNGKLKKFDIRNNKHYIKRLVDENPIFDLYDKRKVLINALDKEVFTSFNLFNLVQANEYFAYLEDTHKQIKESDEKWW